MWEVLATNHFRMELKIIKLRMVGWVRHMACTGEREKYTKN